MRLKAGGKRQRLRAEELRSSTIVMREGGFKVGFAMNILRKSSENIKLQECTVIPINFDCAGS
jgi:hypothetical protein